MAETAVQRLTRMYAFSIFIDGTRTFEGTNATYHPGIKDYAAANFTDEQIKHAHTQGWITQTEYDETMAIKYPDGLPAEETPTGEEPLENPNAPIEE